MNNFMQFVKIIGSYLLRRVKQLPATILIVSLSGLILFTANAKAIDFFGIYGRGMPWQDNPAWSAPGANSMLNLCTDWGCYGIGGFSSHFQRNGNYLPNVPIVAISDGYIESLSWDNYYGCGNYVSVNHTNGYVSKVCHITSWGINPWTNDYWRTGDHVKKGEVIGYIYSDMSQTREIYFILWSTSRNTQVNPTDAGSFEGCYANSQYSNSWDNCPINNFYNIYPYQPVKSFQTGTRGLNAWEPSTSFPVMANVKTYGYFLPQGYNADIISVANQNISYTPFTIAEDPVNTATGNLNPVNVDIEYPVIAGSPLEFRRSYNSQELNKGMLGKGWSTSFDMKLVPNNIANNAYWTILFPDGHGEVFQDADNNYATFDSTLNPVNPESRGTVSRADGSDDWNFTYKDLQTGQTLHFAGNRTNPLFGKLYKITYPNGTVYSLSYNANGTLATIQDTLYGRSFSFTYDSDARLSKVTDKAGRTISYSYNFDGYLKFVTNPLGGVTRYDYNSSNRIRIVTDPNTIAIQTLAYDSEGKVTSLIDGRNNTRTYTYGNDSLGKITTVVDQNGRTIKHWHNQSNYLIQIERPNNEIIKYEYDTKGNRIKEIYPDGKTYSFQFDSKGNRTKTTFGSGETIQTTYNGNGKPIEINELNGQRVKKFAYDSTLHLTSTVDPELGINTYEYNTKKLLTRTTNENGTPIAWNDTFGYNDGWRTDRHVRTTGDVNGDGKADIIGFAENDTFVGLSNGRSFETPSIWSNNFTIGDTWSVQANPRLIADVNGDGKGDIVGFGSAGVYTALSDGTKFLNPQLVLGQFGTSQGWDSIKHIRTAADINGDGKADIIGFGQDDVTVALSTGTGFATPAVWNTAFAYNDTWRVDVHPRFVADVNGDKKADIVGFANAEVVVALSDGTSFTQYAEWSREFVAFAGWDSTKHIRTLADMNGDGKADIVGFGENQISIAYSEGNRFSLAKYLSPYFTYASGTRIDQHPRMLADVDGDGKASIVGFANDDTLVIQYDAATQVNIYDTNGYLSQEKGLLIHQNTTNSLSAPNMAPMRDLDAILSYHFDGTGAVTDASPFGNNPLSTAGGYKTTGVFNSARDFRESGSITTSFKGLSDNSNSITLSFWALTRQQNQNSVITASGDDNNNRLNIHFPWFGERIYWDYGNINTTGRLSTSFDSAWYNQWALWTFTSDPSQGMRIYRNGVIIASSPTSSNFIKGTKELDIALMRNNYNWDGMLDELKIFNKSFSPEEIHKQYLLSQNTLEKGNSKTYQNDLVGNRLIETDALNNATTRTFNSLGQILTSIDPKGNITKYEYTTSGRLQKEINTENTAKIYTYDNTGNITQVQFGNTSVTKYEYDKNGNRTKEIDPLGNTTVTTYDVVNRPIKQEYFDVGNTLLKMTDLSYNNSGMKQQETDGNRVTSSYTYDSLNHIKIITRGTVIKNQTYDFWGNLTSETDWEGNTYEYTYDKQNRLLRKQNPLEKQNGVFGETTLYDKTGNKIEIKDALGQITKQFFNAQNAIIRSIDPKGRISMYEYEERGNIKRQTDFNSEVTLSTYDQNNNLLTEVDNLGNSTQFSYDILNKRNKTIDANNNAVTKTFDEYGNEKNIINPLGNTSSKNYDANGNITSSVDEEGNVISFTYDGLNRKISTKKKSSVSGILTDVIEYYTYDANNNLKTSKDGKGNISSFDYDLFNRALKKTNPDLTLQEFTYSPNGNVLTQKDEAGRVTSYEYDVINRKTKEINPEASPKTYTYDILNRITSLTDFKNSITRFEYDAIGNIIKKIKRNNDMTLYEYNNANNITKITAPNGLLTTYVYDGIGNRLSISQNDGTKILTQNAQYDKVRNLIASVDANSKKTTINYNQAYQVTSIVNPLLLTTSFTYNKRGNALTTTDENSNTTTTIYDPSNNVLQETDALGLTTSYEYNANKNLIKKTDKRGNSETYEYDNRDRNIKVIAPGNIVISQTTYDSIGNILTTTDGNGKVTKFTYTSLNKIKTKTDPLNAITSFSYDQNGNSIKEIDALLGEVAYSYDVLDRKIQMTNQMGYIYKYAYDSADNLISTTNPQNTVATLSYDKFGRKVKSSINEPSIGLIETQYEYDNNSNLVKTIDPMGNPNTNTYDALNQLIKTANKNLEAKEFTYDNVGNLTQQKDENSNLTKFTYDKLNRKTSEIDALNKATTYIYDANNNLLSTTLPQGNKFSKTYDALNRVSTEIDGLNFITSFFYDNNNNLIKKLPPSATQYIYTYDAINRLTLYQGATIIFSKKEYDLIGRQTKEIGGKEQITAYEYNKVGQLTAVIDPMRNRTTYEYDSVGNLIKEIAPNLGTIIYSYDLLGQRTSEVNQLGNTKRTTYNKNGNITTEIDAKGQLTRMNYDINNNMIAKEFLDASGLPSPESTYFEYDKVGNIKKATNQSVSHTYTYDAIYNLRYDRPSDGKNVDLTYDSNKRLSTIVYPDGKRLSYASDANNRVSGMQLFYTGDTFAKTSNKSLVTTFAYDKNGNLSRQVNPDSTAISYKYDSLNRLLEVNNYKHTTVSTSIVDYSLSKFTYEYDNNSDTFRTIYSTNCNKNSFCNPATNFTYRDDYRYDDNRRLTQVTHISSDAINFPIPSFIDTYVFDKVGNRTKMTTTRTGPSAITDYTYNLANQLTSETNWNYTYDVNGNRISKTHKSTGEFTNLTYNRANELTTVNSSLKDTIGQLQAYKLNYKHDAFGRRYIRENTTATPITLANQTNAYSGINNQQYIYLKSEWDPIAEYTNRVNADPTIIGLPGNKVYDVHTNIYSADLKRGMRTQIAAEDVAQRTPSAIETDWNIVPDTTSADPTKNWIVTPDSVQRYSYYNRDAQDTVVSKTTLGISYKANNTTGSMVYTKPATVLSRVQSANIVYDAYGQKLTPTTNNAQGTGFKDFFASQYSGRTYDIETGSYYYGSRYYDPTTGTWNKQDTYRGDLNNPTSRHLYNYLSNSPVNGIDRYGFCNIGYQSCVNSVPMCPVQSVAMSCSVNNNSNSQSKPNNSSGNSSSTGGNYSNSSNSSRMSVPPPLNTVTNLEIQSSFLKAYTNMSGPLTSHYNHSRILSVPIGDGGIRQVGVICNDQRQCAYNKNDIQKNTNAIAVDKSAPYKRASSYYQTQGVIDNSEERSKVGSDFWYAAKYTLTTSSRLGNQKNQNKEAHGLDLTNSEYNEYVIKNQYINNSVEQALITELFNSLAADSSTDYELLSNIENRVNELSWANQVVASQYRTNGYIMDFDKTTEDIQNKLYVSYVVGAVAIVAVPVIVPAASTTFASIAITANLPAIGSGVMTTGYALYNAGSQTKYCIETQDCGTTEILGIGMDLVLAKKSYNSTISEYNLSRNLTDINSGKNFPQKMRNEIIDLNRQKNNGVVRCNNCGKELVKDMGLPNSMEVDHSIPRRYNGQPFGSAMLCNSQVLCRFDNNLKSNNYFYDSTQKYTDSLPILYMQGQQYNNSFRNKVDENYYNSTPSPMWGVK